MRALVVDDREENRYLLCQLLRGHGYAVQEADQGAQALELARAQPPDLVVSDLLMPVMDGYTLLRNWKADDTCAVFLSSSIPLPTPNPRTNNWPSTWVPMPSSSNPPSRMFSCSVCRR